MISTSEVRVGFTARLVQLCRSQRSVSYICEQTGINRQQFAKYLLGFSLPSLENAFKIASFFEISVDTLLNGKSMEMPGIQDDIPECSDYANKIFKRIKSVEGSFANHRFPTSGYYFSYNNSFNDSETGDLYIQVSLVRLTRENGIILYDRRHRSAKGSKVENMKARYYGTGYVNSKNLYIRYADCTNADGFGMIILRRQSYLSNDFNGLRAA